MTISLRIQYKVPEKDNGYFPVATNSVFREYWLPGCQALNLNLVPLFQTGYPVLELNLDTLPQVIDELKQLKNYFIDKEMSRHPLDLKIVCERIDRITTEMSNVLKMWDEVAYIRV